MNAFVQFLLWFDVVVLIYFVLLNTTYLTVTMISFRSLAHYAGRMKTLNVNELIATGGAPPVTLIVPAYDEQETIIAAVRSFLSLNYPRYEILVINDGSRDGTLDRLTHEFDLESVGDYPIETLPTAPIRDILQSRRYPQLRVLDKANGGKADALNAGLCFTRTPLYCALDADTLLERDALIRVTRPFLEDETTVAVGGIIRIVNGCRVVSGQVVEVDMPRNLLAKLQVVEYMRAFLSGRMAWDRLGGNLVISGAFGIFRRGLVAEVGGYSTDTVGEDMDLVVRLHRHLLHEKHPYRITFVPDPVAWTECPESVRQLGRQRDRWQRGLIQSLVRQRGMLFNPRYGRIGMITFPFFFLLEMLGPVVEVLGYAAFVATLILGLHTPVYVFAFLAVAVILGVVLSVAAVGLEELTFRRYPKASHLAQLFGLAVLDNFGFRQLLVFWRFMGTLSALLGRQSWGRMRRKGFQEHSPRFDGRNPLIPVSRTMRTQP